jgi:hypothetical protein
VGVDGPVDTYDDLAVALLLLRGLGDDHDGGFGVHGDLAADRTQQQPAQCAEATRPDDQRVGIGCAADERVERRVFPHREGRDRHAGVGVRGDDLLEQRSGTLRCLHLGTPPHVLTDRGRRDQRVRRWHDGHDRQVVSTQPCLLHGPRHGDPRAVRAVDTDDELAHRVHLAPVAALQVHPGASLQVHPLPA